MVKIDFPWEIGTAIIWIFAEDSEKRDVNFIGKNIHFRDEINFVYLDVQ